MRILERVLPKRRRSLDDINSADFVDSIANVLRFQMIPAAGHSIESANGTLNGKALGYVYGFIDAALHSVGRDMSDVSVGIPISFQVLRHVFPGREDKYLSFLVDHVGVDEAVMLGVMRGGQEYLDFMAGKLPSPMGLAKYVLDLA
ncbi:MAG: hypothetical protein LLG00_04710 [Planctomycetaceae bacterium]|nr:hypothetical protein [Planctomycetaceae bacterium]